MSRSVCDDQHECDFIACSDIREVWLDGGCCDQNTEEVDKCHVHEHVIFGVDHLESGVM